MNNAISFQIGSENRPVVESKNFSNSIFSKQYRIALNLIAHYFASPMKEEESGIDNFGFQGIAFCGERGDGKTSAMLSFVNILQAANKYINGIVSENDTIGFIRDVLGEENDIIKKSSFLLRPIDPTRFVNYNILEVIVGEIYDIVNSQRKRDKEKGLPCYKYNDIYVLFQKVKRSIELLSNNDKALFDSLEDLDDLSIVISLKENLRELIRQFLDLKKSTRLVIPIDDMDMKIEGTFELTERLRKYLSLPEVIVLMSLKPEQMQSAVAHALRKSVDRDKLSFPNLEIDNMAEKYLIKLLPLSTRIKMPDVNTIFDRYFEVIDNKGDKIYANETLKDGVLELIFIKTRYLFYNSLGEVSTLFPDNLRELVHLIGLLAEMRNIGHNGDEIHRGNQDQFKNYFFGVWTDCLEASDRQKAKEWSSSILDYTLNKEVVGYLQGKHDKYMSRNDTINDDEGNTRSTSQYKNIVRNAITDSADYTYNISVGDVFFILKLIEKEMLPMKEYKFIFFVRSLYSIKLYDKYDFITHSHLIYPQGGESGGIYRNDTRFDNVNALQRLVGGAYFTFLPKELIADAHMALDRRVIYGKDGSETIKGLNSLISDVTDSDKASSPELMKLAEFFVLSISHSISSKNGMENEGIYYPVTYMAKARKDSEPIAFSKFSAQRGFYEFNILAPFSNLLNVKYTYERFYNGDLLFERALHNSDSLLCRLWKLAYEERGGSASKWFVEYKTVMEKYDAEGNPYKKTRIINDALSPLYSVAIIRNAEVIMALTDHFKYIRDVVSRRGTEVTQTSENSSEEIFLAKKIIEKLRNFYGHMASDTASMTTHRFETAHNSMASRHKISFRFFEVFQQYLDSLLAQTENVKVFLNLFYRSDFIYSEKDIPGLKSKKIDFEVLKKHFKSICYLTDFGKNDIRSIEDLFFWLPFPNLKDKSQIACRNALDELTLFCNSHYKNKKIGDRAWIDRIEKFPDRWSALLENQYFLGELSSNIELKTFGE